MSSYSGGVLFGWEMLIGVLICACMMSSALAWARYKVRASKMAAGQAQPANVVAFKRNAE